MRRRLCLRHAIAMMLIPTIYLPGCSRPQADPAVAFANRVWKVSRSSSGSTGDLYVFLSDSTLLVASFHGTPALGRWSYGRDTLTVVEEGVAYRAKVLGLSRDQFNIRMYSLRDSVELTFVPAK